MITLPRFPICPACLMTKCKTAGHPFYAPQIDCSQILPGLNETHNPYRCSQRPYRVNFRYFLSSFSMMQNATGLFSRTGTQSKNPRPERQNGSSVCVFARLRVSTLDFKPVGGRGYADSPG